MFQHCGRAVVEIVSGGLECGRVLVATLTQVADGECDAVVDC